MKANETSAADVAPPRRKGCGCWTLSFVALLSAASFVLGVYGFWRWSNARAVDRMIAIAREKGEPTTPEELAAAYQTSSEIERTTKLWLAAIEAADPPELTNEDHYDVMILGVSRPNEERPWEARNRYYEERTISPRVFEASTAYLTKTDRAVAFAHEARRSGTLARFPIPPEIGELAAMDRTQRSRQLADVVALNLELRRLEKPKPPVGEDLLTLLAIAESLRNEPSETAQLVRFAIQGTADSHLLYSLEAEELTDAELLELQEAWSEIDHTATLERLLQALQVDVLRSPLKLGKVKRGVRLCPEEDAFLAATTLRMLLDGADDFVSAAAAHKEAESHVEQALSAPYGGVRFEGSERKLGHAASLLYLAQDAQSRSDALMTLIACERFRRAHGEWPRTLPELVPEWLDDVPRDAFSGDAMIYRRKANEVTVYAVGEDRNDDGGLLNYRESPGDVGAAFEPGNKVLQVSRDDETCESG
jgi:hypothetical protein